MVFRVTEAVTCKIAVADHRVLKAAVLQLHIIVYLSLGLQGAAAGGDIHLIMVAVGVGGAGVTLAGQQSIQRGVQRVGVFGGQVLV